ncbi:MAG: hypothetical protein HYY06_23640 [Deltaproteobacteria bacterium]|nr:hypothetical protein [Deltaproteobacteria bacterium]
MPAGTLPWIVGLVHLLANVVSVLAFVGGRRSDRPRRYAARSAIAAVAVIVTIVVGYLSAMSRAFSDVAGVDPSRKAAALAQGISEAMNLAACGAAMFLLPLAATVYLLVAPPRPPSA